jgi:hypothetical protein
MKTYFVCKKSENSIKKVLKKHGDTVVETPGRGVFW